MSDKFIKRSLHLSPESSYNQARPADNTYTAIQATSLDATGGPEVLESELAIGRTGKGQISSGGTNASGSFGMRLLGLATQGGDGDSASSEDALDLCLSGIANSTAITRAGEGVAGLTGAPASPLTSLELDTDVLSVGDLVCLTNAAGDVAWSAVAADDGMGTYTLDFEPRAGAAVISSPTISRPTRQWIEDNGEDNSASFNGVFKLDSLYREVPGMKINSFSMEWTPRQFANLSFGFAGSDFKVLSAPTFTTGTNGDPAILGSAARITGCLYVDGVRYPTPSISVDFGLEVSDVASTCEDSGRTDMTQDNVLPVITVVTPLADTWRTLLENKALRDIKIVSGNRGPSSCVWFPNVQVAEVSPTDNNGKINNTVVFHAVAVGTEPMFVIARS